MNLKARALDSCHAIAKRSPGVGVEQNNLDLSRLRIAIVGLGSVGSMVGRKYLLESGDHSLGSSWSTFDSVWRQRNLGPIDECIFVGDVGKAQKVVGDWRCD